MFYCYGDSSSISDLLGKTLVSIESDDSYFIVFNCNDGSKYRMMHVQDCCESVSIEEIIGDFNDLIGNPILIAEERVYAPPAREENENDWYRDSETWTFYELATVKGSVTIRWYGTSNGYYSEKVSFIKVV